MDLSHLKPAKGSLKKAKKRLGRGQGSGKGGSSTKGHKGHQARAGYKRNKASEGGQTPLQRRMPKFGFKNIFRQEYTAMNLDTVQELVDKYKFPVVDIDTLRKHRIISKSEKVKVLGRGALKPKIDISAHAFSETAKNAIEKMGGKITIIKN